MDRTIRHNNVSRFSDSKTASTNVPCAIQRAENLAILGVRTVMELCVGPSLERLEQAYKQYGIEVTGNDIEDRWQRFYPRGNWIIGDAREVDVSRFDAVVVAPPLSKNCSGLRLDSLSIEEVTPRYDSFLNLDNRVLVFVLPGKTLSLKEDRRQLHKLLSQVTTDRNTNVVPLKNKVTKYVDLYLEKNP